MGWGVNKGLSCAAHTARTPHLKARRRTASAPAPSMSTCPLPHLQVVQYFVVTVYPLIWWSLVGICMLQAKGTG